MRTDRIIEGIASTPRQDQKNSILEPLGCEFELPLPLLLAHDPSKVVGLVDHVEVSPEGIRFTAWIPSMDVPGKTKDECDAAWHMAKAGIWSCVSVRAERIPDQTEILASGVERHRRWRWIELSLVEAGANPDARITECREVAR